MIININVSFGVLVFIELDYLLRILNDDILESGLQLLDLFLPLLLSPQPSLELFYSLDGFFHLLFEFGSFRLNQLLIVRFKLLYFFF